MRRGRRTADLDVVAAVQEQSRQAAELAAIAGQDRLVDATLNPATRPHADRLRDEQQHRALDAHHGRVLRRHRVADARASEAERTLEALALARRTASPARSVLALHTGRRAYTRIALAASLVLAAGSAMGVEATAEWLHAPTGSGYVAEVGLTGLATAAISYRAHLAEHKGRLVPKSWQSRVMWLLMTVPLLISIGCNLATVNPIGAFCALGATAFALLGVVVTDRSADAMKSRAAEVDAADEDEIRAVAMAEEIPSATPEASTRDEGLAVPAATPVRALPSGTDESAGEDQDEPEERPVAADGADGADGQADEDGDEIAVQAETDLAAQVEEWLARQDPPEAGGTRSDDGPSGDEPGDGTARALPAPAAEQVDEGGHIDAGQEPDPGHIESDRPASTPATSGAERVEPAVQARLAAGDATRERVAQWLTAHPDATRAEAARALRVSESTVKRAKRAKRALSEKKGGR